MSTAINDTSVPFARLNPFDDPTPFNQVRIASLLVLALVTDFNGIKIEDAWKMQKSKSASGATMVFNGTNPVGGENGFTIGFLATSRAEFDQLYDLFEALKPVPVLGGGTASSSSSATATKTADGSKWTVGSPPKPADSSSAEALLAQAQSALANLNKPTPAASSTDAADAQTAATTPQPSPGPRPPTVPIENGFLAFVGVFAAARKSFEFAEIQNSKGQQYKVIFGLVVQDPPKPAGAGAMAAPTATTTPAATTTTVGAAYKSAAGT